MIFEAPQIFTARIDVLIDGTSVNGFPVDIDIFNESLDFSPVFWESDVDVSLSGKKRSNIRGYDLLLRLDYEHTLEPDKFDAIYEQLPNAIRYDTEIRLYPDATDTERYYAVVPTSSTVQSVMYESTVKGADKPTLEFENVELLDSVASYGSPSSAGGDADTLNGFTADDFLKSDANDTYEAGNTLTFNGDVNLQGVVSVGNLGGTPFSIGGVRLFENGDEQKLGVNESPEFAGLAIGNAIGDPFTVGGIRIFDAGDEQELGTSSSPTFGGATFNGNFTAPDYNPSAWDDASDRAPTALSVNLSGILTLTRFNTTNLQADLQAWADTRYTQSSQIDSNWDTAYDRSVTDFRLVTNSLEIVRENAATLDVNLGTWGAGLYFQKALNLSEGDPATMRNNLELGSSDSPTFAGVTLTGALSGTSASLSSELEISRTNGQSFQMFIVSSWSEQYRFSGIEGQMRFQARESGGGARHDIIRFGWDTNYVSFGGDLRSGTTTVIDSNRDGFLVDLTLTGALSGTSATFTGNVTAPNVIYGDNSRKSRNLAGVTLINDLLESGVGFRPASGDAGQPTASHYHILHSQHPSSDVYAFQFASRYSGNNELWFRNKATTWNTWREIWHSGHFTSGNISNWNTAYSRSVTALNRSVTTAGNLSISRQSAGNVATTLKSISIGDARTTSDFPNSNGATGYMPNPNDTFFDKGLVPIFSTDWAGSSWGGILTIKGWSSAYSAWQISGNANTSTEDSWYLRTGVNTSWNAWREIIVSGTTQTINGHKTFTAPLVSENYIRSVTDGSGAYQFEAYSSGGASSVVALRFHKGGALYRRIGILPNSSRVSIFQGNTNDLMDFEAHNVFFNQGTFASIVNINNQLRVDNGSGLPSATYATTLTNATAYFKRSNSGTRIFFGVESWDRGWIQPQHNDGSLYNLLLNPVGGNVGIGITTNPSQRLDVNGNVQADDFILT